MTEYEALPNTLCESLLLVRRWRAELEHENIQRAKDGAKT